jgi:putative ABC transport system permease protein
VVDIVLDAFNTTRSRPGRTLATSLAIAIGVATLVTMVSVSQSAGRHVDERFADLAPRVIEVRPFTETSDSVQQFGVDSAPALRRLEGVTAAAVIESRPPVAVQMAWTDPPPDPSTPLLGVEGDLLDATATTVDGVGFSDGESAGRARVAILGRQVANRLGVAGPERRPIVWIDGVSFRVVGVVQTTERLSEALDAVIVPRPTALEMFGPDVDSAKSVVRVQRGHAEAVADAIPLQLAPDRPERLLVNVGRPPTDLANAVSGDVRNLAYIVAALSMTLGLLAIGNATMRTVFERMPEIGLRRSLGARSRQILWLLVTEAALAGMAGGVLGVLAATLVSLAVEVRSGWPVTLSWPSIALGVALAIVAGAVAGVLPGRRATRISPSEALRRE